MHLCVPTHLQDPDGSDRDARASSDEDWGFFEVSLVLLLTAAPLLLLRLLTAVAVFCPRLGPTMQVMDDGLQTFSIRTSVVSQVLVQHVSDSPERDIEAL